MTIMNHTQSNMSWTGRRLYVELLYVVLTIVIVQGCDGPAGKRKSQEALSDSRSEMSSTTTPEVADQGPSPFQFPVEASVLKHVESPPSTNIRLKEVAADRGLKHIYQNGERGRVLMVETIGAGIGWLDFDNDGRWDLVANQGGDPVADRLADQPSDELFQNSDDLFRPVSKFARIEERHYSQAVAVGDFDNDGFDDFYVSNTLANTLWKNLGDGTFQEIGSQAGVADSRWSSSAAWGDLDLDGDLDLYVCNYVQYDPRTAPPCKDRKGQLEVCNPATLEPWPDACFFNQGDGTFVDQSNDRGLFGPQNRALGVAICDFDRDGWPDIYVANDTTPNFLFMNKGHGQFEDRAGVMGCNVDRQGATQASMGIAVGDFDRNGFQDMYVTNYYEESNTLYANFGPNGFQDQTAILGLHQPTLAFLGFGTILQDLDNDGSLDIFIANGHVDNAPNNSMLFKMNAQLFAKNGKRFQSVGPIASEYFQEKRVGRGVASADFDGDGDLDIAVLNQNEPLALLQNDSTCAAQPCGRFLTVSFIGRRCNRRGIGCRVTVTAGDQQFVEELCGGTTYASSHQAKLHFGLGSFAGELDVLVEWPGGAKQEFAKVKVNQALVCMEP
jgi:enediyne biosynthesis protein E4